MAPPKGKLWTAGELIEELQKIEPDRGVRLEVVDDDGHGHDAWRFSVWAPTPEEPLYDTTKVFLMADGR